jgi:hypothetical protein
MESVRETERESDQWTYVSPRRKRVSRLDRGKADNNKTTTASSDRTTTCYVNNLPEDISEKEMARTFERWGNVVDVYIAKKRNKAGRIFGFVRYEEVRNEKWLEDRLKDVWFGSYKVWVNISKYGRHQNKNFRRQHKVEKAQGSRKKIQGNNYTNRDQKFRQGQSIRKEGMTYAEATTNTPGKRNTEVRRREGLTQNIEDIQEDRQRSHRAGVGKEDTGLSITINEEEMVWAKQGYVGFVKKVEEIHLIQHRLEEEGINSVKVIPMGGERVFLKANENEDFRMLVNESQQVFQQLFSFVREWKPRDVGGDRYVWIRIFGIPVHAWSKKTFSLLTISLGSLIEIDQTTEEMERLDMARLLVRTPMMEFINKMIKVKINNESFPIRITEETCDCAFEEEMVSCVENSVDEDDRSIDSEGTCIPASMASMEDEETLNRIEENYQQLMGEAQKGDTINGGEEKHPENGEDTHESRGKETPREPTLLINEVEENLKEGGEIKDSVGKELTNEPVEVRDRLEENMTRTPGDITEKDIGPAHEASPQRQSGEYEAQNITSRDKLLQRGDIEKDNEICEGPSHNNKDSVVPHMLSKINEAQLQDQPIEGTNIGATVRDPSESNEPQDQGQKCEQGGYKCVKESTAKDKNSRVVDDDRQDCSEHGEKSSRPGEEATSHSCKERRKRRIAILKEKKKTFKKKKTEASKCTCNQRTRTQKQNISKLELLVENNEMERKNWKILHGSAKEIAKDVWDLGKDFGLMHKGEEGEILQELTMETNEGDGAQQ